MSAPQPILECRNLRVSQGTSPDSPFVVSGLNFSLKPGECVALCGPSGAGKTTACLSAFGLAAEGLNVAGDTFLGGQKAPSRVGFRGAGGVAFVFQDPASNFSPYLNIIEQLTDLSADIYTPKTRSWCEALGLPAAPGWLKRFPSECSGGELQRLALVAGLLQAPSLLVADEPTAALDPANRDAWCQLVRANMERGLAVLLVTHDEAVIQALSARRIELGTNSPTPFMVTDHGAKGTSEPPRALLEVWWEEGPSMARPQRGHSETSADHHLAVGALDCVALIGPSGVGKTSLLNLVAGMPSTLRGTVLWEGKPVGPWPDASRRGTIGRLAVVLQQPRQALNPFRSVIDSVAASFLRGGESTIRCRELAAAELEALGVPKGLWHRRPASLSVGQAQRVALAQALGLRPALLVADEPTSAQDAGHRSLLVQRLLEARKNHGMAVLLATHDFALTAALEAEVLPFRRPHPPGEIDGAAIIHG